MVSLLAQSVVDHGLEPRSGQTKKTIKLVFVASPQRSSIKEKKQRMVDLESE